MEINFEAYSKVTRQDAALRNAIRLDCVELVQRACAREANLNCRYADDWNTPLHLAIINRCQPTVLQVLMSQKPDYGLVNGDNLTACELALRNGLKQLGRKLIEVEFGNGLDPEDAIYEMLRRNSVEALEVLIQVLSLEGTLLVECLAKAWSRLEVMNVVVNREIEIFVHLRIVLDDYERSFRTRGIGGAAFTSGVYEIEERMQLIMSGVDLLEWTYDTGLCHDVTDEFLERLRLIQRHLFVVKNRVDNFPAMQLEYCLAMYLAIFDRKPELDLFQLVINKRLLMEFLKQFKKWHANPGNEQRMTHETLFELTRILLDNRQEKCKTIIDKWKNKIKLNYMLKEQIMIRNRILKSQLIASIGSKKFEDLTKAELSLLNSESTAINKIFEIRKMKHLYKKLYKTYFKLKQMYSLQKSVHYLSVIEKIELNIAQSCYKEMLAIQRVLQVLGETLKSTKLSPNISSNLRSVLEYVSPRELLKWITKLRQYFSHEYSATKHTLYRRLRENDTDLINFYKGVKTDLLKVVPVMRNLYADHIHRYFKNFLGYALTMKSLEDVHSYAEASRVRPGFKLNHDLQAADVSELKKQLAELEQSYHATQHSQNLEVIMKIKSKIDNYINFPNRNEIKFMTEMVMCCIGELILCDGLKYQKNLAHFYLGCSISSNSNKYSFSTFLMHGCNPLIRELVSLEARMPDEHSLKRTTIIQSFIKMADSSDVQQLHELTLVKDASLTNITKRIGSALVEESLSDDQLKELNKRLQKYYANLFAIDDKYRVVKTFCKGHKLNYKSTAAIRCRKEDVGECQKVLNDLVEDITNIISLPDDIEVTELVSLIAACGRYGVNGVETIALETILLELLEILSDQGVLTDNRSMLESYRPAVSGRNLRNYLAHDSLIYETICRNRSSFLTLMINAVCLSRFCKVDIYSGATVVRSYVPSSTVSDVNRWMCRLVDHKSELFEAIEKGNFSMLTLGGLELKARQYNKRSVLIAVLDHHSEQIIHFLLERPTSLTPFMEMLFQKALNQEHNFYDDDDFTVGQLFSSQSIRQKMTFYLSMKYHHFELEQELDLLYGGAYTTNSLHLAIIFENEKSALSIIDNERLYQFCKQDAPNFQNTILINAILHKLPKVIRRICEVSPELIERTNTSQETPLRMAISTTCRESIQILLEYGAKVFTNHKSPIIYALQVRRDDLLELLLPSDDVLRHNHHLLSQLVIQAGSSGHHALLDKLLSNLSLAISKQTLVESLYFSIIYDQVESVRLILKYDNSIVNEKNASESTPLFGACYCGSDAMVKLLLELGADCTLPEENPALLCAVERHRRKQFKRMLERKIDCPELQDRILKSLTAQSRYKWIWMILRAGFPLNITSNHSLARNIVDDSALKFILKVIRYKEDFVSQIDTYTLANAVLLGNYNFVKYVLEKLPAKLDGFDTTRLLNCAVKANDKDMLSLLVDAGCQVNSSDPDGITPLAMAVTIGKPDMVKALIKYNANPNLQSMGHCSALLDWWNFVTDDAVNAVERKYYRTYPIILAAMYSHRKIAEYLLKEGAEADIRDQDGFTTLIVAFSFGNVELVKTLISCGVDVEYARRFSHSFFTGGCALHYAAYYGFLEAFKWMVEQYDFDIEAKNSDGNTALHLAIINKKVGIVEYLMDKNLWNAPNKKGQTPLTLALENFDEKVFLCIKSIPPCEEAVRLYREAEDRTLLHAAVLKGSVCLVQVLLRQFDIDSEWVDKLGNTAIYYAVLKKNFELVKLLMDANVSLTGPSRLPSMPPYVAAVLWNQLDIVKLYLEKEYSGAIKLKEYSADGRNLVISSTIQNNFEMSKLLLDSAEFDLNVVFENGHTALHAAATGSSARMVALLLLHGAHIDQANHDGKTALLMALECGNWRVAHCLLSKGASKEVVTDYRYKGDQAMNVLHFVAEKGELDSIKYLLDRDFFEQSVTDAIGRTMGHYAASNKQHDVVEFLISSSFPLDLLDKEGRSPLVCALENEDLQLAKRLKSIGASLDVVQQFNQRHSLLTRAVAERKTDLARFLKVECFLETSVALDSILISLDQIALDGDNVKPLENTIKPQISIPPLVQHLLEGNRSLAEALIKDEASLEELRIFRLPTKDKETVLHVVSRNGLTSCLNLLLENAVFQVDVGDVDQTTALQEAAMRGQLECVKLLLQYGANVNFVDLQNTTALTRAIVNSKEEVANFLLDLGVKVDNTRSFRVASRDDSSALHVVAYTDIRLAELLVNRVGIDVNVRDNSGRTALHYAALMGSITSVEELLKLGAHPELLDHHQRTPFVAALLSGHHAIAEQLLTATSDREYLRTFRMSDSQESILHIALRKGCNGLFMRLLNEYELDCSCVDLDGKSILHYAVAAGNDSLIEQLRFDPDLLFAKDNFGKSPLSICLLNSNLKVFTALIQTLATTDPLISVFEQVLQLNSTQFTKHYSRWLLNNRQSCIAGNRRFSDLANKYYDSNPLQSAILSNDDELIELFLECGVDRSFLEDRDFLNPTTWLHIAAFKNYHVLANVILHELHMPVDSTDDRQQTPLSYAVLMRHTETAAVLLKHGANVNYQDSTKRTPLQTALENNHKEMVQLLLDNNANIPLLQEFRYYNDNQHLVQHYLVERGLGDMLTCIIYNIDLNHGDKHGMTPLHYAAICNQLEMIDLLVSAGATVDCFDKDGTTPLIRALSKGHIEAYRKLLGYGACIDLIKEFRNNAFDGETILHITAEKNRIAPTKLLIEELECDVDCVDKNGNTPLHCAVQKGCFEVVKYLLAKNANIHLENGAGQTAMQMLEATDNDVISSEPTSADQGK